MRKSRLGWYKQARSIELFVAGATGRTAARLVGVNKTTADYFFRNNIRGSVLKEQHTNNIRGSDTVLKINQNQLEKAVYV